jgi:voltage-gated potassium channel
VPQTRRLALRGWLATIFEDEQPRSLAIRLFNATLALLIIANVAGIVLESVDSIRRQFSGALEALEHVATAIFALEYLLRVWVSVDYRVAQYRASLWGRLRYMRSFFAVVDLVSILPAIIGVLGAADLRVLRLLRLLRMLKLVRHSTTFGLLWAILCEPNVFSSIPAAMWWSIETLTTVGYGDMVPMTVAGRLLGGAKSIVGIGTGALFSGLITIGFLDQLKLHRERSSQLPDAAAVVDRLKLAGLPVASPDIALPVPPLRACPHCGVALPVATTH